MIRVLTIEREYGSGGADIAEKLAERLGWKLWDQLLTNEIARLMDCPSRTVEQHEERRDPLHYRLFKAFMRGSFEGSLNAPRMKIVDADCIREVTERVVTAAAKEGNSVIVGRGSAYYLHDRPDAFHVFVYAPFEEKVNRLRAMGKSEEEAIAARRDRGPRPRGLHQAVFRCRVARPSFLPSHGQLHDWEGGGGADHPQWDCGVRKAAGMRPWASCCRPRIPAIGRGCRSIL